MKPELCKTASTLDIRVSLFFKEKQQFLRLKTIFGWRSEALEVTTHTDIIGLHIFYIALTMIILVFQNILVLPILLFNRKLPNCVSYIFILPTTDINSGSGKYRRKLQHDRNRYYWLPGTFESKNKNIFNVDCNMVILWCSALLFITQFYCLSRVL